MSKASSTSPARAVSPGPSPKKPIAVPTATSEAPSPSNPLSHNDSSDRGIEQAAWNARRGLEVAIGGGHDGLDDREIIDLARFLVVIRNHDGNARSPVEDFIVELVDEYAWRLRSGRGLTPDLIARKLNDNEGCRGWFDDALQITRKFNREYAHLLGPKETRE